MAMFSHTFEIMMMLNVIWPAVCTFSCHPPLPLRIFHSAYSGCPKRKLKGGGGGGRWIGRGKGSWRRPNSQSTHISLCVCDLVVVNVARTRRIQHTTTFKRKKLRFWWIESSCERFIIDMGVDFVRVKINFDGLARPYTLIQPIPQADTHIRMATDWLRTVSGVSATGFNHEQVRGVHIGETREI